MNFTFAHNNLNVYDLDASLRFYKKLSVLLSHVQKRLTTAASNLFISVTRQLLTNSN